MSIYYFHKHAKSVGLFQGVSIIINRHKTAVVWFTGLSGSGKTSLANKVKEELIRLNYSVTHLDGDVIRNGLSKNLSFSDDDRKENLRRVAEVIKILTNGSEKIIILASFISPRRKDRNMVRGMVNADNFDPDMDFEILANKPIKQYQIYKEKLIKTKGTPDKNSWDIFIDELLLFYPDQSVR